MAIDKAAVLEAGFSEDAALKVLYQQSLTNKTRNIK